MAFVCPKQEDLSKKRATLDAIADIVNELKKEYENEQCCDAAMPAACFPFNCPNLPHEAPAEPPTMLRCYKVCKPPKNAGGAAATAANSGKKGKTARDVVPVKQSKSRELRAGNMYVGCDCEKRNGLQDDCQRTECHGSPECLTSPSPTCGPSEFCNGKHLGKAFPAVGKNTVSGASYGAAAAQQVHGAAVVDGLEYEYQCFPVEGLELCECDDGGPNFYENSYQEQPCCGKIRVVPDCRRAVSPPRCARSVGAQACVESSKRNRSRSPRCTMKGRSQEGSRREVILWCLRCNAPACLCRH